jgi:hypothetical protein
MGREGLTRRWLAFIEVIEDVSRVDGDTSIVLEHRKYVPKLKVYDIKLVYSSIAPKIAENLWRLTSTNVRTRKQDRSDNPMLRWPSESDIISQLAGMGW